MSNRTRLFTILFSIGLALALVWPNIGERTIHVKFQESLEKEKKSQSLDQLTDYLENYYKGRYKWEVVDKDSLDPQVVIRGTFVQTAFLNEISRQKGVDGSRISVEKMWVEETLMARPFKLGLDLQGGMNLVLEGDFEQLKEQIQNQYSPEYIEDLEKRITEEKDSEKKKSLEAERRQIDEALDFSKERIKADTEGALEIIRSRIDKTGVSEPLIRLQDDDRIEISLPGVASPEQAKKVIASTAKVEYHLGEPKGSNYTAKADPYFEEFTKLETDFQRKQFIKEVEKKIGLPVNLGIYVFEAKTKDGGNKLQPAYFKVLEKEVSLKGDSMSRNVYSSFDPEDTPPQYLVEFELTSEGREKFAKLTTDNKGRELAILIDGVIRSHPSINEPITGGRARISGNFTQAESRDLAIIIREGALPVKMNIVEERSVGPSLGQESIENGVSAILFGLVAIVIYMILYYHFFGLIANLALVLNLLFMSALFALMDFTITLPGLAGVVLTLGMAVDANVIVYERIREELSKGKKMITAVALGFENATRTVLDANLTTLIAAIILSSKLGAGPIKGFGVTLFVGILSTLFTVLFINRSLIFALVADFGMRNLSIGWGKHRKANTSTEASA